MLEYNWINLHSEKEKIELLTDEEEKAIRNDLLDTIMEKVEEYNQHITEYEYAQKRLELVNRGVVFLPLDNSSTIKKNWSRLFASSVGKDEKRKIAYEKYKWHIFSFEKVNALTKSKARQAFNKCKKEKVYMFYQHSDQALLIENANLLKAEDFDLDYDIYIYDPMHKWTYIHTHESECGPYFYQIK